MSEVDRNATIKPLTGEQVKQEATKLEDLGKKFLSGDHEDQSFAAWHHELNEISKHGLESVRSVFDRVKTDTAGINPLLPHVEVSNWESMSGDKHEQLNMNPSIPSIMLGNYRRIEGSVDRDYVLSGAHKGRDGRIELSATTELERSSPPK